MGVFVFVVSDIWKRMKERDAGWRWRGGHQSFQLGTSRDDIFNVIWSNENKSYKSHLDIYFDKKLLDYLFLPYLNYATFSTTS